MASLLHEAWATCTHFMNHQRFLNYIDEIARAGSIRQAAERLHVVPSSVNRRLLDIEEELGTPIFERMPHGMRLTAAGELFINYIRSQSSALEQTRSQIEELKGLRRGQIRLLVSQGVAVKFLPKAIALFRQTHQLVEFDVRVVDHVEALNALRNYQADLALVLNLPDEADIERLLALPQPLKLMLHCSHPLANQPAVRLREALNYPVVLPSGDFGARRLLQTYLTRRSFALEPVITSNSFEFLRSCLHHNAMVSFQFEIGAQDESGQLAVRDIADRGFPSGELVLARLRGRQLAVITNVWIEALQLGLDARPPTQVPIPGEKPHE